MGEDFLNRLIKIIFNCLITRQARPEKNAKRTQIAHNSCFHTFSSCGVCGQNAQHVKYRCLRVTSTVPWALKISFVLQMFRRLYNITTTRSLTQLRQRHLPQPHQHSQPHPHPHPWIHGSTSGQSPSDWRSVSSGI